MICWIKKITDWSHVGRPAVLSWDAPLWSSGTDTGTVTVAGELDGINGDWLIIEGRPYVIKSAAPKNGSTQLTVQLPETAFSRTLRYAGVGTERYGPFIAAVLASEYVAQADEQYAMPYLSVSESDTTVFTFPVAAGETYTLLDIIRQAAAAGVYLTWTVGAAGVAVAIARREAAEHNVFFSGGSAQLSSQTYTNAIVAKATVRQIREDKSTGTVTVLATGTFYWQPDGTVSAAPPDPRIQGDWVLVDVDENTALLDGAVSAMEKNTAAYKVEFYSDRSYALGDVLTLRIGQIVTRAVLSCARRKSGDSRTLYRAGTAAVTLTEKVAAGSGARTVSSGSGAGAKGDPGITFTPSVSSAGVISWTNDGGLPNPAPVNIKGPQGEQGATGGTGPQGQQGEQGVGVSAVTLVSGDHSPGTTDTYNVELTDGSSAGTIPVYNGADGGASGSGKTSLYNGAKCGQGTNIPLSDDWSNYDLLVLTWITNVDIFTQVIDVSQIQSGRNFFAGSVAWPPSSLQAAAYVTFPAARLITVTGSYSNNANWTLGVIAVTGVWL